MSRMRLGVSHQRPRDLTEDRLRLLRQLGVEALEVRIPSSESSFEAIVDIKRKVESAGFELHEIMLSDLYSAPSFTLNRDGRDRDIETFKRFVADLGRAGVRHTTYAWHTGGAYETGRTQTRGAETRRFELGAAARLANAYERAYGDDELWQSYAHFIHEVLPVAAEAGVRLQLHPNDPPVDHQGVARIFSSTDAFARAMEISDASPYSGILFCVGTWSEMTGPDGHGEDIEAAIRRFGAAHIFQVHLRNVSAPLPDFHETFPDDGYRDLCRIMRTLDEVGFDGMVVPDHVPDAHAELGEAFTLGYIRGLIQAVTT